MRLASSKASLALALVLCCAAFSAAAESPAAELREVTRLYRDFEYEKALAKIAESDRQEGPTAVKLTVLEGIIYGELNKRSKSVAAFRRALRMDPGAKLPFEVAPKVSEYFRAAQAELEERSAPEKAPLVSKGIEEPAPSLDEDVEPGRPGSRPKIKGGAWGLGEALGRGLGGGLNFGIEWAGVDASVRLSLGSQVGLGLEVAYLFDTGRLRPLVGARGWFFPGLGALGGGPVVGAELSVVGGLYLSADAAAEFYAVPTGPQESSPEGYQTVGLVFTVGLGYAF